MHSFIANSLTDFWTTRLYTSFRHVYPVVSAAIIGLFHARGAVVVQRRARALAKGGPAYSYLVAPASCTFGQVHCHDCRWKLGCSEIGVSVC